MCKYYSTVLLAMRSTSTRPWSEPSITEVTSFPLLLQAFMCITIRDHFLHRMLVHVASTPVTSQLYQECSFFRDSSLLSVLVQTLESLNQVDYSSLEKCLTLNIL